MSKISVLIVDDSAVVRQLLSRELSRVPDIEVTATAPDPYIARDKIIRFKPDVLILDIEMPRMDGITFLEKLMKHYPLPVVIFSSLTPLGCSMALKAVEAGAVEVMHKPALDVSFRLQDMIESLADKLRAAAAARYRIKPRELHLTPRAVIAGDSLLKTTDLVVAMGASTGGTEALRYIIGSLPASFPGTIVTQHMPAHFTKAFADSLNNASELEVKEAEEGDTVQPGRVLIAPGNYHMELRRSGARYYVSLNQDPPVCRQRPSVEVMFRSVARYAGTNSVGVILTGMGNDGAQGLMDMRNAGAVTVAQDEASCIVYGMPGEAVKLGAAERITALEHIPGMLVGIVRDRMP
mgnify:CR=1 FL=1